MAKKGDKKWGLGEGLGISGFTLGTLSIILAGWIGILVGIVGAIFCFVQQKNQKTKFGKIGLILNIIGIILSIILVIVFINKIYPIIQQQALAGLS